MYYIFIQKSKKPVLTEDCSTLISAKRLMLNITNSHLFDLSENKCHINLGNYLG